MARGSLIKQKDTDLMADLSLGQESGPGVPLRVREAFSGWPMLLGWAAMLLFAFHACTHMVAAGDTWVAMACGRHFVNHGVDTVEPFSNNSHKAGPTAEEVRTWPKWAQWVTDKVGLDTVRYWHPTGWINQNWLTHVLFYRLTTALGSKTQPYYDALVLWKFAIYILAAVALYFTARVYGVNRALAVPAVCFALFAGRSFFDVRPAGFSNLLVAVLLLVFALASYKNALYIWLIVPLTVFWSNVHGGYIYVFVAIIPFVVWHLLMNLPRRWMIAAYSILLWLVLYALANRVLQHENLQPVAFWKDGLFYLVLLAGAGSIALLLLRQIRDSSNIAYHVAVSCALFLIFLLVRFLAPLSPSLSRQAARALAEHFASARLAFLGIFLLAMTLGAVVIFLKDKMVRVMKPRGVLHAAGAGVVAFVAMVIFNPFHLTNLTHTFVISVSGNAERWRDVHEWHRAFDWSNPVGTAYPFLFLFILGWLLLLMWTVVSVGVFRTPAPAPKKQTRPALEYPWSRMDLSLFLIAALTIYMAIRSRRFIPIAAFTACPILALLTDRLARTVSAVGMWRSLYVALVYVDALFIYLAVWLRAEGLFPASRFWHKVDIGLSVLGILLAVALSILLIERLVRTARVVMDPQTPEGFRLRPVPDWLRWGTLGGGALIVLVLGLGWGLKFKRVYLDYWPADAKLKSVFMRMTASDAKPFLACQFLRDNKLSGNMFNYWTEGGFIAWGEEPDPQTGRIPLRLFMDGRAQAAYDVPTFDLWTGIMSGGPTVRKAFATNVRLTAADYAEIGDWVSEELRKHNVWVVLMPNGQFDKPFTAGLDSSRDWRLVFLSDKEKLFVDVQSPQGAELYQAMLTGKAVYPDEYHANLALGHNLLMFTDPARKKAGLELIIKAFNSDPTPAPIIEMWVAAQFPELRPRIDEVCEQYVQTFDENKKTYVGTDGYNLRIEAARLALARLEQAAKVNGNAQAAATFHDYMERYRAERDGIALLKRW
jgi:hypothetical protein